MSTPIAVVRDGGPMEKIPGTEHVKLHPGEYSYPNVTVVERFGIPVAAETRGYFTEWVRINTEAGRIVVRRTFERDRSTDTDFEVLEDTLWPDFIPGLPTYFPEDSPVDAEDYWEDVYREPDFIDHLGDGVDRIVERAGEGVGEAFKGIGFAVPFVVLGVGAYLILSRRSGRMKA